MGLFAAVCILICMDIRIDFDKAGGLVPAIAQDAATGQVLMMAWMNREAFDETLRTGRAVYFSRSRNKLWRKGEESGNFQEVREVFIDCDADTILLKVHQIGGAACHEGFPSCFFRKVEKEGLRTVGQPLFDPKQVYKK
jgi:phosphoribosyl-AMP cyclohydrolase